MAFAITDHILYNHLLTFEHEWINLIKEYTEINIEFIKVLEMIFHIVLSSSFNDQNQREAMKSNLKETSIKIKNNIQHIVKIFIRNSMLFGTLTGILIIFRQRFANDTNLETLYTTWLEQVQVLKKLINEVSVLQHFTEQYQLPEGCQPMTIHNDLLIQTKNILLQGNGIVINATTCLLSIKNIIDKFNT